MRSLFVACDTTFDIARVLLRRWHERPHGVGPSRDGEDFEREHWNALVAEFREFLASSSDYEGRVSDGVTSVLIDELVNRIQHWDNWQAIHAAAWSIDLAHWELFTERWEAELLAAGIEVYSPNVGDLIPVADGHLGLVPFHSSDDHVSTRPWSVYVDADDLPHIRVWRIVEVSIEYDLRIRAEISAAMRMLATEPNSHLVTIHPNVSPAEFKTGQGADLYPVVPVDEAEQRRRFLDFIEATDLEPLVVFPELVITETLAIEVAERLNSGANAFRDQVVVLGSAHAEREGQRSNILFMAIPGVSRLIEIPKFRAWRTAEGSHEYRHEGIHERSPRSVIYCAGRFRLVACVCLDLMDPRTPSSLSRAGANVVLAAARSTKTDEFETASSVLVSGSQCLVVIANGPIDEVHTISMISRPLLHGRVHRYPNGQGHPAKPGMYLYKIKEGTGSWVGLFEEDDFFQEST